MMVITRTPFRISFFGGGTDFPLWYQSHGGAVLSTTIDKYCHVSCRDLPPFFDYKHRIVYSKTEMVNEFHEIQHPVVRECLKFMNLDRGFEIHHDSDIPAASGLGTSSSFTVGLLHALYGLKGEMVGKKRLAYEAIQVEQNHICDIVGSQDQTATAFGGLNKIEFLTNGEIRVQPVVLSHEILRTFKNHLLLYFTGFSRMASKIEKKKLENFSKKTQELQTMHQMVDPALEYIQRGEWELFGRLLHEAWKLKRSLANEVSTLFIDHIYEEALRAGALGGKILGAGGGGFILFFVRPEDQPRVRSRLVGLLEVPFEFENLGSHVIFYNPHS